LLVKLHHFEIIEDDLIVQNVLRPHHFALVLRYSKRVDYKAIARLIGRGSISSRGLMSIDSKEKNGFRIEFQPLGLREFFPPGLSLLECARQKQIDLVSLCGGTGTCGKCKVQIVKGKVSEPLEAELERLSQEELEKGIRLACRTYPEGDLVVHIPPESLSAPQRLSVEGQDIEISLDPSVRTYPVSPPPPTVTDLRGDDQRLFDTLEQQHGVHCDLLDPSVAVELSLLLRDLKWEASAVVREAEVLSIGSRAAPNLGVAVDLGSTKIAGYLVDLDTGKTLSARGVMNPQISHGEDVASRLTFAGKSREHTETLQKMTVDALNGLFEELCRGAGFKKSDDILEVVVAGNTAMHHLFCGLQVDQLARAPHVPAVVRAMDLKGRHMGLSMAGGGYVHLLPNIAGYVGGDHVAMLLAIMDGERSGPVLGIDIGTNTEISLIARGEIRSVSCASGPAFEGAHITCGMRAAKGAIEHMQILGDQVHYHTIEDARPIGICGSGIFDALAEILSASIIDKSGRIVGEHPMVRERDGKREVVLAEDMDNSGSAIVITQKDIRELQLAKGAIRTGIDVLLKEGGLSFDEIDEVVVAGAFGSYLDLSSAVRIGMLPNIPADRFQQVGNAAGVGAKAVLVSKAKRAEAQSMARRIRYVELAGDPDFQEIFVRSLQFD
jgi:uncharacterized 2Fe-2S/4Fe-4S cluster protein (DUF4445 family)